MIEVIPAIDIIGGKCVRLSKGDYSTQKDYGDPFEMARVFEGLGIGKLHLIDLDGAKSSEPENLGVLEKIASLGTMRTEWGGGIKSDAALSSVFDAGADQAIIGSIAVTDQALFKGWLGKYGSERIILGADLRDGKVSIKGWKEDSPLSIDDLLDVFKDDPLRDIICTDISRDGMLGGPATELYTRLKNSYPGYRFTASGGIGANSHIGELDKMGIPKVVVGKAIYEKRISLEELSRWWQNA